MSEHIIDEDSYSHISKFGSFRTVGEVIRCRECAYFGPDKSDHGYRAPWWCDRWSSDLVAPDGFCAWAKRRES